MTKSILRTIIIDHSDILLAGINGIAIARIADFFIKASSMGYRLRRTELKTESFPIVTRILVRTNVGVVPDLTKDRLRQKH